MAYSGYVDAANKGVDESLVSDVSYALQLVAYADTSFASDTAYIVGLQYDDEPVFYGVGTDTTENPDELVSALEASFGSNLSSALQLKYSGWSLGAVSGLVSYSGSSFAGNEDALLSDIQVFTNAYKEFLEKYPNWTTNFASEGDAYIAYLSSLGVDTSDSTAVANATALYLASCAASADVDEHIAWWCNGLSSDYLPSEYEDLTLTADRLTVYMGEIVAWEEAIYQYEMANGNTCDEFQSLWAAVQSASGYANLLNYTNLFAVHLGVSLSGGTIDNTKICASCKNSYAGWKQTQAASDCKAYLSCLTALNESASTFTSNLSNSTGDLYTDGTAYTTVVSYVSTASAIDAAGLDGDDAVAITVCRDSNGNIVVTTYMNGTASSTSSTDTSDSGVQSVTAAVNIYDASTVYTSMMNGSTIYGSIGSGSYSLSVGETMYINLTASLTDFNTLMNGLGQKSWSLENLVYGMQSYDITNTDSTVVETSPSCASSGSDTVTFTITVTALSEGTATIGLNSFDGAYTITVTE